MMRVGGTLSCGRLRWVISASAAVTSVMCLMIAVSMPTPSKGKYYLVINVKMQFIQMSTAT